MSRKNEILDALGDMLQSQGLHADFTISELARKVDIGKSTIYEYFSTKDELISEAMIRIFENAMARINDRTIDPGVDFETALKDELRFVFDLARESSAIFRFLTPEFRDTIPATLKGEFALVMRSTTKRYEALYADILRRGFDEGVVDGRHLPQNNLLVGALINGMISQITRMTNGQVEDIPNEQLVEGVYDAACRILR
jgi:AcrR family transcriptional regulator